MSDKKAAKVFVKASKKRRKQFKAAREEFSQMRNRLLLENYTLHFSKKPPKGRDTAASIYVSKTRSIGVIRLGEGFYSASDEARRHYVTHELLHIILARVDYLIADFRAHVSPQVWDIHYTTIHREIERVIDHFADIVAPFSLYEDQQRAAQLERENVEKVSEKSTDVGETSA